MATNLLEMLSGSVGKQLVEHASGFLGGGSESNVTSNVTSAVSAALPALLAGLMQKSATPSGASDLMRMLDTPELSSAATNIGSFLGGGEQTSSFLSLGGSLLSKLFGDKVSSLVSSLASISGLKSSAASNLMALATPMVLGAIKSYVTKNGLNAGGLANLLAGQAEFLKPRLDNRLTNALGFGSVGELFSSLTGAAGRTVDTAGAMARGAVSAAPAKSSLSRWLPWVVLGALALFLLPQLRTCGQESAQKVSEVTREVSKGIRSFQLPNGVKIDAREGGFVATLISFLNSKEAALGKGYSFDEVYFDTGSATIKAESTRQLEQLASVMKAYPTVVISVDGHTDNTGDAATNQTLSADRAAAVEKSLERMGIEDARITSAGHGSTQPIASNDTEDGRARNRRVEVVVMKR